MASAALFYLETPEVDDSFQSQYTDMLYYNVHVLLL